MNLVESIFTYFSKKNNGENIEAPEGICPNCWGTQEYDGKFREMFKDRQIDVNNREANYAFIQDFVVTHIDGIRLKSDKTGLVCAKCRVKS